LGKLNKETDKILPTEMAITMTGATVKAYEEFAEFIVSEPSLEQIANFQLSSTIENRMNSLLETCCVRTLNTEEEAELSEYLRLEHLVRRAKMSAVVKLAGV
jgi:hydroxymethylpyrimidine/phosphomethylpyrimidine kinase